MAKVTHKGNPIKLKGDLPKLNSTATDFTYVKNDLKEESLYDLEDKVKVIIAVPSLDTSTCATETRKFNEKLSEKGVIGIVISKDLPFAQRRFCETDGIKNIMAVSDFRYNDFTEAYNTEILDGALKGLSARAVIVLDEDNIVRYTELVPEISSEPDYDKALAAVDSLL
jgi:thiol peroxidase